MDNDRTRICGYDESRFRIVKLLIRHQCTNAIYVMDRYKGRSEVRFWKWNAVAEQHSRAHNEASITMDSRCTLPKAASMKELNTK